MDAGSLVSNKKTRQHSESCLTSLEVPTSPSCSVPMFLQVDTHVTSSLHGPYFLQGFFSFPPSFSFVDHVSFNTVQASMISIAISRKFSLRWPLHHTYTICFQAQHTGDGIVTRSHSSNSRHFDQCCLIPEPFISNNLKTTIYSTVGNGQSD